MAASLPAKLQSADIQRFAKRAAQLEKFRPIVSYWCEYYILQRILGKGLHTADEECSSYAVQLMDRVETKKAQNATNEAIVDDVAAKAYIENFALETFNRGDDAQRTNKVTVQTADTFQAASTFMELLSIWGELDSEISAKIKFAKFHAMRILKALKAGEDPNASNPVVEDVSAPTDAGLEAELRELERSANDVPNGSDIQAAPESRLPPVAPTGNQDTTESEPLRSPSQPHSSLPQGDQATTLSPADSGAPRNVRQSSIGGGYFPTVPSVPSGSGLESGPEAPSVGPPQSPPINQPPQAPLSPHNFYGVEPTPSPFFPFSQRPHEELPTPGNIPHSTVHVTAPASAPAPAPAPQSSYTNPVPSSLPVAPVAAYRTDDEATMAAQKHAKFAISALNFEDVNTAVKELRLALQSLGGL